MGIFDSFRKKNVARPVAPKVADKTTDEKPSTKVSNTKTEEMVMTRGPLAKENPHEASRILLRPLFTEKNDRIKAFGQYSFIVARNATKVDVARAIKDLYGVKVTDVRMLNVKGKQVRFGRFQGKEKDEKKAIVKLAAGQTLTVIGK